MNISIQNVGPIVEFEYELDAHGLIVLRGKHGAGKTHILRLVELASNGRTDITPTRRDGAKQASATIGGKTLRILRRVQEEGDIGVDGLGDLNIADLHLPKFKEPHTRDKHRINTLLRLTGAKADASKFHRLTEGEERFNRLIDPDALKTDDPVEMAARIKRSLERHAQAKEQEAETARANQAAQQKLTAGVDLNAAHDETALREAATRAIECRAELTSQRRAADAALASAAKARESLAACGDGAKARCDAQAALKAAEDDMTACRFRVESLERQLAEAKAALQTAAATCAAAAKSAESAERHATMADEWRAAIEAAESIARPTDEEIAECDRIVSECQKAAETGAVVRKAHEAAAKAKEFGDEAVKAEKFAQRLRLAASQTIDVLSELVAAVPNCPLRVAYDADGNPRLVIETARDKAEPFDDLSDGQRWIHIVAIAAGSNRIVVLPQAAFGELADSSRDLLDSLAKKHGFYILSAQVDDGPLRAEAWAAKEEMAVSA